jgi:hypothetical protein
MVVLLGNLNWDKIEIIYVFVNHGIKHELSLFNMSNELKK